MPDVATVVTVIGTIYGLAESLVKAKNASKAAEIRKKLDQVLSEYNKKIDSLRNDLEKLGLDYNLFIERYRAASPSGSLARIKHQMGEELYNKTNKTNSQIKTITNQMNQYSAIKNKEAADLENRSLVDEISNKIGAGVENIKTIFGGK